MVEMTEDLPVYLVDDLRPVSQIQMRLLTSSEIRDLSKAQITQSQLQDRNLPKKGGLLDHRLGPSDRKIKCGTCDQKLEKCSSHIGSIHFPLPLYLHGMLETTRRVLSCVCYFCSKFRFSNDKQPIPFETPVKKDDEDQCDDQDCEDQDEELTSHQVDSDDEDEISGGGEDDDLLDEEFTEAKDMDPNGGEEEPFADESLETDDRMDEIRADEDSSLHGRHRKNQSQTRMSSVIGGKIFGKSAKKIHTIPNVAAEMRRRFNSLLMCARSKKFCVHCGLPQPTYSKESLMLKADWGSLAQLGACPHYATGVDESTGVKMVCSECEPQWKRLDRIFHRKFTSLDAHSILKGISDSDCRRLGFDPEKSRPENLVPWIIPVAPISIRPSISISDSSRTKGHDDLTHKLQDIVRHTLKLSETIARHQGLSSEPPPKEKKKNPKKVSFVRDEDVNQSDTPTTLGSTTTQSTADTELFHYCPISGGFTGGGLPTWYGWKDIPRSIHTPLDDLSTLSIRLEQVLCDSEVWQQVVDLQYHYATYVNNDIRHQEKSTQRSGQPIRTIRSRYKGKEGRFRGNQQGKRVDFCARTVISPDPYLLLDEVGVPEAMALKLTRDERVTLLNIAELQRRCQLGSQTIHGAYSIEYLNSTTDKGKSSSVTLLIPPGGFSPEERPLQIGWIVHRFIQSGDIAIFNRQPSLHRMSMMGHVIRLHPEKTFTIHPSVTTPYNADFDGDEMNLHIVQSEGARTEVKLLMGVAQQIISPQTNLNIMSLVQDALVASLMFTSRDTFLNRGQAMQLVMCLYECRCAMDPKRNEPEQYTLPTPALLKPVELWTGKQLVSLMMPECFTLERVVRRDECPRGESLTMSESSVVFRFGEMLSGTLCKETVGQCSGGLIQTLFNDFGAFRAAQFINQSSRMFGRWIMARGFSCGLSDCVVGREESLIMKQIYARHRDRIVKAYEMARELGVDPRELEQPVYRALKQITDDMSAVISQTGAQQGRENQLELMPRSGSKGKTVNIVNIKSHLGQQQPEGRRPRPKGTQSFSQRTFPCFANEEEDPVSRGFIQQGYLEGIDEPAFFAHAMGAREGLVATAVATANTGYAQRKNTKSTEGQTICGDRSVRDSDGNIISFLYGRDGFDGCRIELCRLRLLEASNAQLRRQSMSDAEYQRLIDLRDQGRLLKLSLFTPEMDIRCWIPTQYSRLLNYHKPRSVPKHQVTTTQHVVTTTEQPEEPEEVLVTAEQVYLDLCDLDAEFSRTTSASATVFVRGALWSQCSPRLVTEHGVKLSEWRQLVERFRQSFHFALAATGEMVGVVAAQSIGEPCTQLTLNMFHYAGQTCVTLQKGVPRLKELTDCIKDLKTPSVTLWLDQRFQSDEAQRTRSVFVKGLPILYLSDIVSGHELYDLRVKPWPLSKALLECFPPDSSCRYLIAFRLNEDKMNAREFLLTDLSLALTKWLGNVADVFTSDARDTQGWFLYIRLRRVDQVFEQYALQQAATQYRREQYSARRTASHGPKPPKPPKPGAPLEYSAEERLKLECFIHQSVESSLMNHVPLAGVVGIRETFEKQVTLTEVVSDSGELKSEKRWIVETLGTNLKQIIALEGLDWRRICSNNIAEVINTFGIGAGKQCLFHEIQSVLTDDGRHVDPRHITILVETMTRWGYLMPLNRHGINRLPSGFLGRASFEEGLEIVFEAAASQEVDEMTGVTQAVMVGNCAPIGTRGSLDLVIDQQYLLQCLESHRRQQEVLAKIAQEKHERWTTLEDCLGGVKPIRTQILYEPSECLPPPLSQEVSLLEQFLAMEDLLLHHTTASAASTILSGMGNGKKRPLTESRFVALQSTPPSRSSTSNHTKSFRPSTPSTSKKSFQPSSPTTKHHSKRQKTLC
jgi:DNA-directed RNA polymerase beta' subunit